MRTLRGTSILIIAGLALASTSEANPTTETAAAEKKEESAIDPKAIGALKQMGAYLQKQNSFSVRTKSQTEYVLDNGQKVTIAADGDLRVQRPDHLRADVTSDRKARQFFYNGKTFIMNAPEVGFYACVIAPPTLRELADELSTRYGLQLPMVDLFRWGSPNYDTSDIKSAMYVGPAKLNGIDTDHYAFRQPDVDWQVWIERGAHPVPRKVVLTTTDDPARPEYAVEMTWMLGVTHDPAEFAFTPPKDSQKIALSEVGKLPAGVARSARRRQPK